MTKKIALILGIVFTVVGLVGFVPNPVVGMMPAWFEAGTAHSLVHLISGLVFIFVALKASGKSALVMKVFGIVYLLVAILGFFGMNPVLWFIDVNSADNWLHLVLGAVITAAGFGLCGKEGSACAGSKCAGTPPTPPTQAPQM